MVYDVLDRRDLKLIEGVVPASMGQPLPEYHWHWFDRSRRLVLKMGPVPPPDQVATQLANRAPYTANAWHPFAFTSQPGVGRSAPARASKVAMKA